MLRDFAIYTVMHFRALGATDEVIAHYLTVTGLPVDSDVFNPSRLTKARINRLYSLQLKTKHSPSVIKAANLKKARKAKETKKQVRTANKSTSLKVRRQRWQYLTVKEITA